MFWTEEKLALRLKELEGYRYREAVKLDEWLVAADKEGANGTYPGAITGEQKLRIGDYWTGNDVYLWLHQKVSVPIEWKGSRVVGLFDFGKTGGGNNKGFESLLFLNGVPYQGVDSNHQEVFLEEDTAGKELDFTFRLWSGLNGDGRPVPQEHRIIRAELAVLDEAADNLYYTGRAALDTVKLLAENQIEKQELLMALNRSFNQLDWSRPGSASFYSSVREAEQTLLAALAGLEQKHPVTVTAIGHTHIDVAWLWRLAHTREKAARSFSTVLRLMKQFPEYVFLQTQPQLYAYIKQDYPEIYDQIKQRVEEGRWEAGGAMWLEADCNLTSGESLVRQILYGTKFFREEFGVECKYLWLPDVFGYSWALPQILRKSGIDTFMTTKISWSQYNRMPHDTFRWRGIDGSEVLTHFITTPDAPDAKSWYYTYNGLIEPFTVQGIWNQYQDKNLNRELLLSYGYGDGGGGVNREMLEMRRRLDAMPGIPQVKPGRADEYFERLHETVGSSDQYVHTWDGELYLEFHRGTYTSQAYNKRMNRKLELLYREAEWLQVLLAAETGSFGRYPAEQLAAGWQIILRNQFHDIIPGSSIHEVYEDSRVEYAEAEAIGLEAAAAATTALVSGGEAADLAAPATNADNVATPVDFATSQDNVVTLADLVTSLDSAAVPADPATDADKAAPATTPASGTDTAGRKEYTLFNSALFTSGRLAVIPHPRQHALWVDAAGEPLAAQRCGDSWLVAVPELPQLGSVVISARSGEGEGGRGESTLPPETPFTWQDSRLTTPFYILEWNEAGQLSRIYDRKEAREVLAAGEYGNVLQVFEDKPRMYDAWDIDLFYQEKMRVVTDLLAVELVENGPLSAELQFTWKYIDSSIIQQVKVYAASRRIDFETQIDWQEQQQLLKTAFPVAVRATEATYDIQFGNVKRPTHWNTSWDYARFESVGHQWADLSERGYGVSLLNDCKYGYDIKDHVLRLSLIKSATSPDPFADQGEHRFTYALLPHAGDWAAADTVQEAWALNNPLHAAAGAYAAGSGKSLLTCGAAGIAVDAVKLAEDGSGWIVRLHEYTGARCSAVLGSDYSIVSWQECDLLERPLAREAVSGPAITLEFGPYEIHTLLVKFV
ncbi:alpha-mannosidase [Paenibacillus donghaensis]|uniref:Alpha-mannosidase n=1 Tax=Paenibacillus donghaensis TaxID=414771 RepID=A0A2Z2KJ14_9BACL|nr:alpha-mannosidase [Paenibacillus donghaensis]ASA23243.1 alpha-mannosidase [Paenibacillus donghaensis]